MTPPIRTTRVTPNFVEVRVGTGGPVSKYFYLRREGRTWTVTRALGLDYAPKAWDGWKTQKAAIAFAVSVAVAEEAVA
jgi:hypothetical protein